ncbi:phospholipid/cholesterol/gamma-HCH transport system substrate-binding protein [Tsukamurella pulmonis]|uniref:Phospholipid/cholesterol/gamma-HCH transport system substrate-binding protein n=1 Tax=Tsukamurella pulmonis TaxID=47312 RepID=A0A1H1D4M2_9ACTN|nr:MlaD family protein [Tsukamurella pulmonis]SDQ71481.1 phospholipid/cholesterol/gamma-HCH transport system substrate-binding protein [Tsukamurella pulmonis]SUP22493.1 virulence factor Mce family protein [Tsukamurella pulmonis]
MGVVSVPGMSVERSVLRRRGLIAVAVIIVIVLVGWLIKALWPKDEFSFTLRSPAVAAGVVDGAPVRIQGIQVGTVTGISALGNGQQGVKVTMKSADGKSLTNNLEAAYSAGNLFGVTEVILTPHDGGGQLQEGAQIAPTKPITDNTVSNMIATIGDVNSDALRPHMSQILLNFDASSKAMLPLFTAFGSVAQAVQDTQRLTTAETFPQITRALGSADSMIAAMVPGLKTLYDFQPVHDKAWVNRGKATLDSLTNERDSLTAALQKILSPAALKGLETSVPMLVNLMQPLLNAFPNGSATGVGIQIGELLDNVRKAMPNTPTGPMLNLRLAIDYPAVSAMLPPAPTFQYIPPKPGEKPAAKPTAPTSGAPSSAKPSTPTPKPGS